jgi:hypothetical protein
VLNPKNAQTAIYSCLSVLIKQVHTDELCLFNLNFIKKVKNHAVNIIVMSMIDDFGSVIMANH